MKLSLHFAVVLTTLFLNVSYTRADVVERSMTHGGLERWFLEIRSSSFVPGNPVLIKLHDAFETMENANMFPHSLQLSSEGSGYMILCPNAVDPYAMGTKTKGLWNVYAEYNNPKIDNPNFLQVDDVGFLKQLALYAIQVRGADPQRVYIMGTGMGGYMVARALIDTYPPLYAGASALLMQNNILTPPLKKPNTTTPLFLLLATDSGVTDYNGGIIGGKKNFNVGMAMSANKTVEWWADANKADFGRPASGFLPNNNPLDRCRIQTDLYPAIDATTGAPVLFHKVIGGGHSLPSKNYPFNCWALNLCPEAANGPVCNDANAVDEAWSFMSQYKLKTATAPPTSPTPATNPSMPIIAPVPVPAPIPLAPTNTVTERSMMHGGLERWYLEIRPPSFKAGNPVVIILHGAFGGMYSSNAFPNSLQLSSEINGFMILCPNAVDPFNLANTKGKGLWNMYAEYIVPPLENKAFLQVDDVGFVNKLAQLAISERGADAKRVYLMGGSNGAAMVARILMDTNPPIYAAASALGMLNLILTPPWPKPPSATPMFLLFGTLDGVTDYNGGITGGKIGLNIGLSMSADKTVEWWTTANKADYTKPFTTTFPDLNPFDNCRIQASFYSPLDSSGAPVLFHKVNGGGHALYSRNYAFECWGLLLCPEALLGPICTDANAVDEAWNFMSKYTLNTGGGGGGSPLGPVPTPTNPGPAVVVGPIPTTPMTMPVTQPKPQPAATPVNNPMPNPAPVPVPVTMPNGNPMSNPAPVPVTTPAADPSASTPNKAPTKAPSNPMTLPTVPVTNPTLTPPRATPTRQPTMSNPVPFTPPPQQPACGFFGLGIFCIGGTCGLFGRLFGLCQ